VGDFRRLLQAISLVTITGTAIAKVTAGEDARVGRSAAAAVA